VKRVAIEVNFFFFVRGGEGLKETYFNNNIPKQEKRVFLATLK
jgi:hypothetical protein